MMAKDYEREYGPREEETPFYECDRCGREVEEQEAVFGAMKPDEGYPEVLCPACEQKQREWEKSVGLDQPRRG